MSRERVVATVLGASGLLVGLLVVPTAPVSALPATTRHIAFTDDRNELRGALLEKPTAEAAPRVTDRYDLGEKTTHEGEASVPQQDFWSAERGSTFVSTREGDADGEVYVTSLRVVPVEEDAKSTEAVTCDNGATESHPVITRRGDKIAYASDLNGSWDIYVATKTDDGGGAAGEELGACEGWTVTQLTDVGADDELGADRPVDLWPAWTPNGQGLVFSSTREDPLGDLYYLDIDVDGGSCGCVAEAASEPLRLTDDPGAETQATITSLEGEEEGEDWVAFTTTSFLPEGSLAFLRLSTDPEENPATFHPAWADGQMQSSEAAWSPQPDPSVDVQLAFTSTETDPASDIWVAEVGYDVGQEPTEGSPPVINSHGDEESPYLESETAVVAEPGVAESHAAWREGFQDAEPLADLKVDGQSPTATVITNGPTTVPVDASGSMDRLNQGLTYTFTFDYGDHKETLEDRPAKIQYVFQPPSGDPPPFSYTVTVTVEVENALGATSRDQVVVTVRNRSEGPNDEGPTGVSPATFVDGATLTAAVAEPDPRRAAVLVYTARSHDADISDVLAADGSGRRTLVARTYSDDESSFDYDEAGPDYSDDGEWLAYSRDVPGEQGRLLVAERLDGTQVLVLPAGREEHYVDVDPAWSPDGTRVAFTRYRAVVVREQLFYAWPQVWVVDVSSGSAHTVSVGELLHDTGPTWSPDGDRIALARAVGDPGPTLARSRAEPMPPPDSGQQLTVVDAADGGNARPLLYPAPLGPRPVPGERVLGDSPAWSADGQQIAFHHRGAIRVIDLADTEEPGPGESTPDEPETVIADRSVTGFQGRNQNGGPTESRSLISVAEDPAWASDGSEIAFAGQPAGRPDQRGIYAIEPDGTGVRTVAQLPGPETEPTYGELPNPRADVSVKVVIGGSPALTGDPITATYTVTNKGPTTAQDVVLTTSHTADGDPSGSGPGCSGNGSGCGLRDLDPGETFDYVVTLEYDEPVTGTARGKVTTASYDPQLANNEDEAPYVVVES